MKIKLPPTLTAEVDVVYPDAFNWAKPTWEQEPPHHEVLIKFGDAEVKRIPFTEAQEARVDYNVQYNDEILEEIVVEVAAQALAKLFE